MDFDGQRYMGTWFAQVHTRNEPYSTGPDENEICITAQYSDLDLDTGIFKVYNSGQHLDYPDITYRDGIEGTAKCPAEEGIPNWCSVSFFDAPYEEANYEVFETDYDSYTLIYDCRVDQNFLYFYIMARDPIMDDDLFDYCMERAQEVLPHYDFTQTYRVVQDDRCVYPYSVATELKSRL